MTTAVVVVVVVVVREGGGCSRRGVWQNTKQIWSGGIWEKIHNWNQNIQLID